MACTNCQVAIGGVMRGGARAGYLTPLVVSTIGGVRTGATASRRVLIDSLSIHDAHNEAANTATFTVQGLKPIEGAEVMFAFQSINNSMRLFAGHLIRVTQIYVGQNPTHPPNVLWQCEATDYTWTLNSKILVARYRNLSASVIVAQLMADWAPAGFTVKHVQPNLPVLDEITMTNITLMDAIRQVATRIGGYGRVDYFKDLHFWIDDPVVSQARDLTADHGTLEAVSYTRDLSQIVTRALVEGGGVNALAEIAPGRSIIPVDDAAWYDPAGGLVVSGPQRIRYTGLITGGKGSIVGPGVAPTSALTLALQNGSGIDHGVHNYAYTFTTATGETVPSALTAATTGPGAAGPSSGPGMTQYPNSIGYKTVGRTYEYAYAYSMNAGGTDLSALTTMSAAVSFLAQATTDPLNPGRSTQPLEIITFSGDSRVLVVQLFVRVFGDSTWRRFGAVQNSVGPPGSTYQWPDNTSDADLANLPSYPGPNTTPRAQVNVTAIAAGPVGTTGRKIYRTPANAAAQTTALRLLTTIADNTTTSYLDTKADSTLGAAPPATDTSGLAPAASSGTVPAGSSTLRLSSTVAFPNGPGWVRVSTQTLYHTGKTDTDLTGIPASGPGAITSSIAYNTMATIAPQLIGIPAAGAGAIGFTILTGDPVNLLVVVDDAAAQAALAALIGGDGIQVSYLQDRRISRTEAAARGRALLEQRKQVRETVRYQSRDQNTRTGDTVTANLPSPYVVVGDYQIQDLQIHRFHPRVFPVYDATASSDRYTFEDLLRRQRGA